MNDIGKKERKLTKAEEKRKEEFEAMAAKLSKEGYTQKMIGINNTELNTMVYLLPLPIMALFIVLYIVLGHRLHIGVFELLVSLVVFYALIMVHEALHGVTWMLFAKNRWKSISFGFIKETFNPYCNCNEPLKKYQIILGTLMPTLILGVGFGIASLIFGSTTLLIIAVLNLLGCGGDLLVILKLLLFKSDASKILFIDHPYEIGTAVFEKR